jgi:hypothetical protein
LTNWRCPRPAAVHDAVPQGATDPVWCALAFYALAMLIDQGAGTLTLPRAGLWTGLAIRRQAAAAVSGMSGTRSNSLSTPWVASFAM